MVGQHVVELVKNDRHALSRDLNLVVWGATPAEAVTRFQEAATKDAEIRARPDPFGREEAESVNPAGPERFASPS
jgi:hypothetical protein